jgi:hypothetical protein
LLVIDVLPPSENWRKGTLKTGKSRREPNQIRRIKEAYGSGGLAWLLESRSAFLWAEMAGNTNGANEMIETGDSGDAVSRAELADSEGVAGTTILQQSNMGTFCGPQSPAAFLQHSISLAASSVPGTTHAS